MPAIKTYLVLEKNRNLPLEIAKEAEKLYIDGLELNASIRKAKEIYRATKDWNIEDVLRRES